MALCMLTGASRWWRDHCCCCEDYEDVIVVVRWRVARSTDGGGKIENVRCRVRHARGPFSSGGEGQCGEDVCGVG